MNSNDIAKLAEHEAERNARIDAVVEECAEMDREAARRSASFLADQDARYADNEKTWAEICHSVKTPWALALLERAGIDS